MKIRAEVPDDVGLIRNLHRNAFPGPEEARLVDQLRADGAIEISLVACEDDVIIGHVLFSRMAIPPHAIGLGPVAVTEPSRRQGVAANLIITGIEIARNDGWTDIFVLGDPAYYDRFGFRANTVEGLECAYAGPHLMALTLRGLPLKTRATRIEYARAFLEPEEN